MLFPFSRSLIGAAALLALAGTAHADLLVNTGTPDGSGALAVDANDWLAGEVTVSTSSVINSINAFLDQGNAGDTFTLAVYGDQGGSVGNLLYSEQTTYQSTGWNGASDLGWSVGSGNYWVGIEVHTDPFGNPLDTFAGVAPTAVPNPLEVTAFNFGSYSGYQTTLTPLAFGLEVDTSPVPEPESYALLAGGLVLMALARRRGN